MTEPGQSPSAISPQSIRALFFVGVFSCGMLVLISVVTVSVLVSARSVTGGGLGLGVALGLVSWFGSTWVADRMSARRPRPDARSGGRLNAQDPASIFSTAINLGVAAAELPALVAVYLAVWDGSEIGPLLVSAPVAIVAMLVNITNPGAMRRRVGLVRT